MRGLEGRTQTVTSLIPTSRSRFPSEGFAPLPLNVASSDVSG